MTTASIYGGVAQSSGLYGSGNTTYTATTYFEWLIFKESATAPATPTGGSWNFTTNTGTPPTGWSASPPTGPTNPVWFSLAIVNSGAPSTLTWTASAPLVQAGPTGPQGPQGIQGPVGTAATIAAGTTTTGVAGTSASVVNSGTSSAAVFNFTIPRGDTGATGPTGATGAAATIAAGTTTTLSAGSSATVTNVGTSGAAIFNFGIPRGADASIGGSNTQVQYNNGGVFAGSSNLTFDSATGTLASTIYTGRLKAYTEEVNTIGTVSGTTRNLDLSTANIFDVTLGNNVTFTFTNPPASGISRLATVILRQDATGSRTAVFTNAKYTDGNAPQLSTGANQIDVLTFFTVNGGTFWFGTFAMANVS
jgi:hypothetical protein